MAFLVARLDVGTLPHTPVSPRPVPAVWRVVRTPDTSRARNQIISLGSGDRGTAAALCARRVEKSADDDDKDDDGGGGGGKSYLSCCEDCAGCGNCAGNGAGV